MPMPIYCGLVAGDAEQMPAVVEELVQVVRLAGCLAEQRREQGAVVEEHGEDRQERQRQHGQEPEVRSPESPVHKVLLLGVLAPVGISRSEGQSPGSRISANPGLPDCRSAASGPLRARSPVTVAGPRRPPTGLPRAPPPRLPCSGAAEPPAPSPLLLSGGPLRHLPPPPLGEFLPFRGGFFPEQGGGAAPGVTAQGVR